MYNTLRRGINFHQNFQDLWVRHTSSLPVRPSPGIRGPKSVPKCHQVSFVLLTTQCCCQDLYFEPLICILYMTSLALRQQEDDLWFECSPGKIDWSHEMQTSVLEGKKLRLCTCWHAWDGVKAVICTLQDARRWMKGPSSVPSRLLKQVQKEAQRDSYPKYDWALRYA